MNDRLNGLSVDARRELLSPLDTISSPKLRSGLVDVFVRGQQLVDDEGFTLVVLTARRIACVYQLLLALGMPKLHGCRVVSDRFLDARPNLDWPNEKVLVIDDSVIVGTTISRLHEDLAQRVGKVAAVKSLAVCVDTDQRAKYLLDTIDLEALHDCTRDETRRFSEDLVRALFENQVPFFSDFPVCRPIEVSTKHLAAFVDGPWHAADVTAPMFAGGNVRAIALIPNDQIANDINSKLPPEVAALVDGFKIRLYLNDLGDRQRLVVVPLGLVGPASTAELHNALTSISNHVAQKSPLLDKIWEDWSPEAKHRLVQLYVSACVLAEVWDSLTVHSTPSGSLSHFNLDHQQVDLYFGDAASAVLSAFDRVVSRYVTTTVGTFPGRPRTVPVRPPSSPLLQKPEIQALLWTHRELIAEVALPEAPQAGHLAKTGLIFSHAISAIFGFINKRYELPQRRKIRNFASRHEYDEYFSAGEGRLIGVGLTMHELASELIPMSEGADCWTRSLISLGIDPGNDLGIIVPVTLYSKERDVAFRSYRLGETAHLADRPLAEAVRKDLYDSFTRAAEQTQPVQPDLVRIDEYFAIAPARRHQSNSPNGDQRFRLVSQVDKALPGRIERQYVGTIRRVDGETLEANIVDRDGEVSLLTMNLDQLPHNDIAAGMTFSWTVFVNDTGRTMARTSRVTAFRTVPFESEHLTRAADELEYLTGYVR